MTISYTRAYDFDPPYVDGVDPVSAGGKRGLNAQFFGLEAELDTISGVVSQVDTAITGQSAQLASLQQQVNALGGVVNAPVTLGFTPLMLPFNAGAADSAWSPMSWSTSILGQPNGSYVNVPATNAGAAADGILPLTLPEGVTLLNLAVLGQAATPGNMTTTLVQELRTSPFTLTQLAVLTGFISSPIQNSPVFSSDTHLFYLRATITGAAAGDVLRGFVITYLPSS